MKILHTTHKGFTDTRAGFTLIETLFAILIFTASIVSLMMLSGRSLASTAGSSDELTARYLAQEGIEVTRNVRDTNFVANAPDWLETIRDCTPVAPCAVDYSSQFANLVSCGSQCGLLYRDPATGTYGNSSSLPEQTTFSRNIFWENGGNNQALITSRVTWQQKTRKRTVEFKTIISKWR